MSASRSDDVACRVVGLGVQGRPQAREATADDAQVRLRGTLQLRVGVGGWRRVEPVRHGRGVRVGGPVLGGRRGAGPRAGHAGPTVARRAPAAAPLPWRAMGRSRRRRPAAVRASARTAPAAPAVPATREVRRILAAHLLGAVALAVVVLGGTILLGGALAPWVVLAFVVGGGLALHAWATGRLAGAVLTDEDRVLQTMAEGLVILAAIFALVAAVLLTVT